MLTIGWGVTIGFSSPSISLLTSEDTPLPSGPITMEEASWFASFICLGGMIGNFVFAYITNNFGRKKPLIMIAVLAIVSNPSIPRRIELSFKTY